LSGDLELIADQSAREGGDATAREIAQQPAVWREVNKLLASRQDDIDAFLRPLLADSDLRVVLTGAGTSAFAGEILAPALSRRTGRGVDAVATTDIVSNPEEYFADDRPTLLVSFARSGNSPESVAATEFADRYLLECHHLVLTCNRSGRLYEKHARSTDSFVLLMPEATNDQGFAMTSSFTSMILAAWLVLGAVADSDDLVERLAAAAELLMATRQEDIRRLASSGYERIVYLGSGPLKGLAHESSLKLLELTAGEIVTYFESPLGFRHGPKSILDDRTLAVSYISGDPYTRKYDLDLLAELRRSMRPGSVIAVAATDAGIDDPSFWLLEHLEGVEDAALALPFVLVAQLLGLCFSLALGYTPDNPFPNREVNRVVQGVSIHPLPRKSG
jgi:tagatose-6-phosphate ketose/aldose isomerase